MFTFERVGDEPEMYIEDYAINYDNGEPFIINDYYDDENGDCAIIPVISIDRNHHTVELYDFAYVEARPCDRLMVLKVIDQLLELKEVLQIDEYLVVGEGASIYNKLYNTSYIK